MKPFDDPLTDVGLVQRQCEGKSGAAAAGLDTVWKVLLLPAVGFSMLCMMKLAL